MDDSYKIIEEYISDNEQLFYLEIKHEILS